MRVLPLLLTGCVLETNIWGEPSDSDEPDVPTTDLDGDGYTPATGDCDETSPIRHEGRDEACDGVDNDCNGVIDVAEFSDLSVCQARTVHDQQLRVDVLVVLDNTESMSPHWSKAADGACAMVEHLMGKGLDTQIGVVMTDLQTPGTEGLLVDVSQKPGDHPWIDGNASVSLLNACNWLGFALGDVVPYLPVEPDSSGGRAAVLAAMDGGDNGDNDGFFRAEADLAVLFVSDEEDGSAPDNFEFLTELYDSKFGTGGGVTMYALTQTSDEDCQGNKTAVEATSVLELVGATQGSAESICLDSYSGFLSAVGQEIASNALGDTFRLDSPAQFGSVEVTIETGGESYPWAGAVALSDPETVVFLTSRPPAGATIVFDYLRAY